MKSLGIIPARYQSSRFPGKPLIDIQGATMIQRVYAQATQSDLDEVIVATDDQRIFDHVRSFDGKVALTGTHHQSGTDRCGEIARKYKDKFQYIINIQGDEPFIDPSQINLALSALREGHLIATLVKRIQGNDILENPNVVKVIFNIKNDAIYFSRYGIPFYRKNEGEKAKAFPFYKHIGLYGFELNTLIELTELPVSLLEKTESLEQLRWLYHGYSIYCVETELETIGIDTPEDLKKL